MNGDHRQHMIFHHPLCGVSQESVSGTRYVIATSGNFHQKVMWQIIWFCELRESGRVCLDMWLCIWHQASYFSLVIK